MSILAQQLTATDLDQVAPVLFLGFGLLTVASAWAIVFSQNIVRMAVYLLFTLAGAAGLYFMLEAELLAAIQLIVYTGGTLILIVFGVMLTSGNPFLQVRPQTWEVLAGVLLALAIPALLIVSIVSSDLGEARAALPAAGYDQIEHFGYGLLSVFLVPFEIAAVLLLVVMIAAAYLVRRRSG